MKMKVTNKLLKNNYFKMYVAGYCDLQGIMQGIEPRFYNAGVYGWNFDVFESPDGRVVILPDSNNRAVTIDDGTKIYLQSYDTLILSVDTFTGEIKKMWDGYSVTTLKHINTFLAGFGLKFNKKSWIDFKGTFLNI